MTKQHFLLLLYCTSLFFSHACAQRSFECQRVWDGPSADNSIGDCLLSKDRFMSQLGYFALAIICAIGLLALLVGIPFTCCALCDCCCLKGKTKIHKDEGERKRILMEQQIIRTKTLLVALTNECMLGVVLLLLGFGSIMVRDGIADTISGFNTGPLAYFSNLKKIVWSLLTNSASVNFSMIDNFEDSIRDAVNDVRDSYLVYAHIMIIAAFIIGALGLTCGAIAIAGSLMRCPGWFPAVIGWLFFVLSVLYMIFALVLSILAPLLSALCGEVILQYERVPGIMQWFLVPSLEDVVDLRELRNSINDVIHQGLTAFCDGVLDYCTAARSSDYFTCGGISSSSDCVSVDYVLDNVVPNILLLPTLKAFCPPPESVIEAEWECTIFNCSTMCTTSALRDAATFVVEKSVYVSNVSSAYSYVEPLFSVDYLLDLFTSVVEAPPTYRIALYHHPDTVHCSQLRGASWMMAAGFFIGSVSFIVLLFILVCTRSSWTQTTTTGEGHLIEDEARPIKSDKRRNPLKQDSKYTILE